MEHQREYHKCNNSVTILPNSTICLFSKLTDTELFAMTQGGNGQQKTSQKKHLKAKEPVWAIRWDDFRVLLYPYTDVFLVCFDLQKRASFENARTKWVAEIHQYRPGSKKNFHLLYVTHNAKVIIIINIHTDVAFLLIGNKKDMRRFDVCHPYKSEEHRKSVHAKVIDSWSRTCTYANYNGQNADHVVYVPRDLVNEIVKFSAVVDLAGCVSSEEGRQLADAMGAYCYVECSALTQEGLSNVFDIALTAESQIKKKKDCLLLSFIVKLFLVLRLKRLKNNRFLYALFLYQKKRKKRSEVQRCCENLLLTCKNKADAN
ncbi:hypothetical protein RFI_25183 [Reticulomyxa filosa]|uniref:Uncharacterized protein n=1 Tax=Reticulomyxa filosa TaxID=46433 RepID=X6MET7_RETFI|nr:hypothetical protein RFI_25183 [Reticulomyxa filosa]|eukprot:ETO12196.1 hypothetical protein RFI_25183 [Reticulomyxa filosa]